MRMELLQWKQAGYVAWFALILRDFVYLSIVVVINPSLPPRLTNTGAFSHCQSMLRYVMPARRQRCISTDRRPTQTTCVLLCQWVCRK